MTDEPTRVERLLAKIPAILNHPVAIGFGVFLFFYLVVFAGIMTLLGDPTAVSTNTQLILGNYTNVTSAIGASIAAGTGVAMHRKHRHTLRLLDELLAHHRKADMEGDNL